VLLLATLATTFALAGSSGVVPCDRAIIGHGSADWRNESVVAGPVGVRRHPLRAMSQTRNGLVTKMPLLVEGRAPETVTVSVPPALRQRAFLYYGTSSSFADERGYGEIEFQLCGNKPRTIWPGGIRIKGDKPVHLLVSAEGQPVVPLRLGRPRAYEPRHGRRDHRPARPHRLGNLRAAGVGTP
jgi:hypothetical protein